MYFHVRLEWQKSTRCFHHHLCVLKGHLNQYYVRRLHRGVWETSFSIYAYHTHDENDPLFSANSQGGVPGTQSRDVAAECHLLHQQGWCIQNWLMTVKSHKGLHFLIFIERCYGGYIHTQRRLSINWFSLVSFYLTRYLSFMIFCCGCVPCLLFINGLYYWTVVLVVCIVLALWNWFAVLNTCKSDELQVTQWLMTDREIKQSHRWVARHRTSSSGTHSDTQKSDGPNSKKNAVNGGLVGRRVKSTFICLLFYLFLLSAVTILLWCGWSISSIVQYWLF